VLFFFCCLAFLHELFNEKEVSAEAAPKKGKKEFSDIQFFCGVARRKKKENFSVW
jgi:hypothetical protein